MAIFGDKESRKEVKEAKKEARENQKITNLMNKYHLNELSHDYADAVKSISLELQGTGLIEFGKTLSGMKSEDTLKVSYLNALVQQNWIMIRQLDEISKKLDK